VWRQTFKINYFIILVSKIEDIQKCRGLALQRLRRRRTEEKKSDVEHERKVSELEQLAGNDKETYEALCSTMFLDPRKIEISLKQAADNAEKSEKDKDMARAGMWYEVAGGLAIYEGNVKKVIEHFTDAARVTGRQYVILKNPEKAVAVAQEYYKKVLLA
jgi:hypothetical protein